MLNLAAALRNKFWGLRALWRFDNRWQLIASRLGLGHGCDIYIYRGMKILIDHKGGDASGTRECLTSNMYSRYLHMMSFGDAVSVLDLGANGGGFPLLLKSAGLSVKKLVCVEMNPNTFNRLRYNIDTNFDCQRHCLNMAVGGANVQLMLHLGYGSTGDSLHAALQDFGSGSSKEYRVACRTFDYIYCQCFADEIIDICKIDIEGAERDVLLSGEAAFLCRCRYLIIEIHSRETTERAEILGALSILGFGQVPSAFSGDDDVYLFVNHKIAKG